MSQWGPLSWGGDSEMEGPCRDHSPALQSASGTADWP